MQASQYFALIAPVCAVLLGLALVACWALLRRHQYLLWLAAAYILPAVPLSVQSLASNNQLSDTAVLMGAFYLAGMWAMAQGMAAKYNGSAYPRIALAIGVVTLGLLYYFSNATDDLPLRMLSLNMAMLLLLLLGVAAVYRSKRSQDRFERLLRGSYLAFLFYSLIRLTLVSYAISSDSVPEISHSPAWLMMLAANLLLGLWFVGVIFIVVVREVIAKIQNERDVDPLTQLLNRRAFFERAPALLSQKNGTSWALLVCDVDHFKQINDTLGHATGDEALKVVANTLVSSVRHDDLVARFGGEEFVVMLRCAGIDEAKAVANRIRIQLCMDTLPDMARELTASFGAVILDSAADISAALSLADSFLYHAKQTGRNKVVSGFD